MGSEGIYKAFEERLSDELYMMFYWRHMYGAERLTIIFLKKTSRFMKTVTHGKGSTFKSDKFMRPFNAIDIISSG